MAHYNSEIRVQDAVKIRTISLDLEDGKFDVELNNRVRAEDGEWHHINFQIAMPLSLIQEIAELLPIAIEKAKSHEPEYEGDTYQIFHPEDLKDVVDTF